MTHGYFQIVTGADDTSAGDATELKWEFDEDLDCYYVSFPDDQQVEPIWDDRGSSIWGYLLFIWICEQPEYVCTLNDV